MEKFGILNSREINGVMFTVERVVIGSSSGFGDTNSVVSFEGLNFFSEGLNMFIILGFKSHVISVSGTKSLI